MSVALASKTGPRYLWSKRTRKAGEEVSFFGDIFTDCPFRSECFGVSIDGEFSQLIYRGMLSVMVDLVPVLDVPLRLMDVIPNRVGICLELPLSIDLQGCSLSASIIFDDGIKDNPKLVTSVAYFRGQ